MKVCIAEKPSVAAEIAKVLGATSRHDGYFEGNGYQVTWTYGHLCELKKPEGYYPAWKKWDMCVLPMIPSKFGIELMDDGGIKKQFGIIKHLYDQATEIINCGDAGQEGELIQRWVMQLAGVKCPVKRLWVSSLTEEAIRAAFANLKPSKAYDNLYLAGAARAAGDWLLGMNCTRLYTVRYVMGRGVLSIGRVQTPTLALIVSRDNEIEHFHPEPYWVLATAYRGVLFTSDHGKYTDHGEAQQALSRLQGTTFTITSVEKRQGREQPSQLYDLTALQVDCNKKHGYSADETLKAIQSLYEKKLTTYPRVDTRYLSDDIFPKCKGILDAMSWRWSSIAPTLSDHLAKSKRVFDTSKVTDHHALMPTGVQPGVLPDREQHVYDMICDRFVAVFMPDCKYETTSVAGQAGGVGFKASGKHVDDYGWRKVYGADTRGKRDNDDSKQEAAVQDLPSFAKGEGGAHKPSLAQKTTKAPSRYTEATLLQAMETAGKFVEDEELARAMKENGIGRPSSRAGIIETLLRRGVVVRQQKNLVSTVAGRQLISVIKSPLLKSCELTGLWEKKLRQIERGEYDSRQFIDELKQQLVDIIKQVKSDASGRRIVLAQSTSKSSGGRSKSQSSNAPSKGYKKPYKNTTRRGK